MAPEKRIVTDETREKQDREILSIVLLGFRFFEVAESEEAGFGINNLLLLREGGNLMCVVEDKSGTGARIQIVRTWNEDKTPRLVFNFRPPPALVYSFAGEADTLAIPVLSFAVSATGEFAGEEWDVDVGLEHEEMNPITLQKTETTGLHAEESLSAIFLGDTGIDAGMKPDEWTRFVQDLAPDGGWDFLDDELVRIREILEGAALARFTPYDVGPETLGEIDEETNRLMVLNWQMLGSG